MKNCVLDGNRLTIPEIFDLANATARAKLGRDAQRKIERSRALIERWTKNNEVVYGVTTGFGEFANTRIMTDDIEQ